MSSPEKIRSNKHNSKSIKSNRFYIFFNSDNRNFSILIILSSYFFLAGNWRNGYAYTYYSAAAQAGSTSWKAFFFGSIDSANFITVDKPPMAVWFSSVSSRIFGLSPFSILLPHAIAGMLSALVLYLIVRRIFEPLTAFLAGFLFIIIPASSVVFRYNMTDSFLMFFVLVSIYCFIRSLEKGYNDRGALRWLFLSAFASGCAFNTKMVQGLMVVPLFVVMYFYNAKKNNLTKIIYMLFYSGMVVVSSLWWALIVGFVPSAQRPWIGSTTDNSIWELIFVHNGLGRLLGANWKQPTGQSSAGVAFGGEPGLLRMFNGGFGPNYIWLLGVAIGGFILSIWAYRHSAKYDMVKNHIGIWLFSSLIYGSIFSFTKGTIHPYYALAFVPGIAAIVAITLSVLYSTEVDENERLYTFHILVIGACIVLVGFIPLYLLPHSGWAQIAGVVILGLSVIAILVYLLSLMYSSSRLLLYSGLFSFVIAAFTCVVLSSINVFTVQQGFMPTTKPLPAVYKRFQIPEQSIPSGLKNYLLKMHKNEIWIAAAPTAIQSAPIQLSTGKPVIALAGFSGADNPLTLNEFRAMVEENQLRYYVVNTRQSRSFGTCVPRMIGSTDSTGFESPCKKGVSHNERSTPTIEEWVVTHHKVHAESFGVWDVYDLFRDA